MLKSSNPMHLFVCLLTGTTRWLIWDVKTQCICLPVDRYNQVVEACALQSDFDSLLSGDLTEVGRSCLYYPVIMET